MRMNIKIYIGLIQLIHISDSIIIDRLLSGDKITNHPFCGNTNSCFCTVRGTTFYTIEGTPRCIGGSQQIGCQLGVAGYTNQAAFITKSDQNNKTYTIQRLDNTNICGGSFVTTEGRVYLQSEVDETVWVDKSTDYMVDFVDLNKLQVNVKINEYFPGLLLKINIACYDGSSILHQPELCALFKFSGEVRYNEPPVQTVSTQSPTISSSTVNSIFSSPTSVTSSIESTTNMISSSVTVNSISSSPASVTSSIESTTNRISAAVTVNSISSSPTSVTSSIESTTNRISASITSTITVPTAYTILGLPSTAISEGVTATPILASSNIYSERSNTFSKVQSLTVEASLFVESTKTINKTQVLFTQSSVSNQNNNTSFSSSSVGNSISSLPSVSTTKLIASTKTLSFSVNASKPASRIPYTLSPTFSNSTMSASQSTSISIRDTSVTLTESRINSTEVLQPTGTVSTSLTVASSSIIVTKAPIVSDEQEDDDVGLIVGVSVVAVLVILLLYILLLLMLRKRKAKKYGINSTDDQDADLDEIEIGNSSSAMTSQNNNYVESELDSNGLQRLPFQNNDEVELDDLHRHSVQLNDFEDADITKERLDSFHNDEAEIIEKEKDLENDSGYSDKAHKEKTESDESENDYQNLRENEENEGKFDDGKNDNLQEDIDATYAKIDKSMLKNMENDDEAHTNDGFKNEEEDEEENEEEKKNKENAANSHSNMSSFFQTTL